jgi:hypothetical protein
MAHLCNFGGLSQDGFEIAVFPLKIVGSFCRACLRGGQYVMRRSRVGTLSSNWNVLVGGDERFW